VILPICYTTLGWIKQIPALVSAGYRVWAPDQRGYNLSDKPEGLVAFNLDELAADVIGLIDAAGAAGRCSAKDMFILWLCGFRSRRILPKL